MDKTLWYDLKKALTYTMKAVTLAAKKVKTMLTKADFAILKAHEGGLGS